MDEALKAKILETLSDHHMMALATIRPDGFPQATTVNYVHDDLILYFATDASSQKAANIGLNNKVSAAIAKEQDDFYKLRGLSLSGIAQRIVESDKASELTLSLFRKLPQSRKYVPEDSKRLAVYSITPLAISLIDYSEGYGKTYLMEFGQPNL